MSDDVISRVEEHLSKVGLSDECAIDNSVNEMTYADLRELLTLARGNRDATCAHISEAFDGKTCVACGMSLDRLSPDLERD